MIEPDKSGQLSSMLRDLKRQLRRQRLKRTASLKVSETTDGTIAEVIQRAAGGGSAIDASWFYVSSYTDTQLTCVHINYPDGVETFETEPTIVEKPLEYRNGNAYTASVTAAGSTTNVSYELIPSYANAERVLAVLLDDGKWWEVGPYRAYWPVWQRVVVCYEQNGATVKQYMLIRGSAPFGVVT